MAFEVRTDKEGHHDVVSICRRDDDRWSHSTFGFGQWADLPIGTRFVFTSVFRPKHLPPLSVPRPDGLHELVLARKKVDRYSVGYGEDEKMHERIVPVFVSPTDPKKRPARVHGNFAFADDAEMVRSLIQFESRREAERTMADLFKSYAKACKKEAEQAKARQALEDRERMLEERAAEVGVTVDELKSGIDAWNRIRAGKYRENECMVCHRPLTDPASIVSGIGPECVKHFPGIKAAARAKVIEVGRMRFDGQRLIARFKRAGVEELVAVIESQRAAEHPAATNTASTSPAAAPQEITT
jgi:hypothetical protein